jgi:hypothetical protein
MKRVIKLTIEFDEIDDNTPTAQEMITQLRDDLADVGLGVTSTITLETEYDE